MMTEIFKNIGRLRGDRVIWLLILFFAMISMAVVYSATSSLAYRHDTSPFRYLIDQAGFYIVGFIVLLICYRIPMKWYRILSYAAMGLSIILLTVPAATGHLRSFTLLGVPVHPAEIAKVATVLYLARVIEASPMNTFKEYALKILLPVGLVCALAMLGSMSATLIIGTLSLIILVCAGIKREFILWTIPIAVGAVAVAFTVSIISHGRIFSRFDTFGQRIERHFAEDETESMSAAELAEYNDKTFQSDQAREAIQLGGIFGRGPGNSIKRDILPNAYDDYIYSIIIEEYGLIGGVVVIILYLWFFYRCMKIARACTRKFSIITVLGLSTLITMQAFLHIFVNVGILPVTGQTLPMISHGGTALIIMNCAFGIILADAIRKIEPEADILFVGAEGKMEMERVPAAGYRIIGLPVAGLQRSLSASNLALPAKVLRSLRKAGEIIRSFKPDVVVGVGGYASAPMLWKAASKGIPTLIQEQNSYAGLTNKILSRKARRICTAYPGMNRFFPAQKIVLTGNPIRDNMRPFTPEEKAEGLRFFNLDPALPTVLVVGGSGGCGTFNSVMRVACRSNDGAFPYQIIWQSGKGYYSQVQEMFSRLRGVSQNRNGIRIWGNIRNCDFISRMDLAFAAADIVVSRAGAGTISELCSIGKATIFVPSPNVAEDHQTHNAMSLVDMDAAVLVCDSRASTDLFPAIEELLNDRGRRAVLEENILKMARPDAAVNIAREVLNLIDDKKHEDIQ